VAKDYFGFNWGNKITSQMLSWPGERLFGQIAAHDTLNADGGAL
jgi:hypothetical protein